MNILLWIVLGVLAGWIASTLMSSNHGLLEDIILGVVGAFVGGFILNYFGKAGVTGLNLYSLVVAVAGAMVVIFIGRIFHK
jgi:uncharacterized membrane protein YeaQ/YmgE (transglycosylase-associated protein family)